MQAWGLCSDFKSGEESKGKLHTNFDFKNIVNLSFLIKMHTENHVELDHCKREKKKQYTDSKFSTIQCSADCNVPSLQFLLALQSQYHNVPTATTACGCRV